MISAFGHETRAYRKAGRFRRVAREGKLRFYESRRMPNVALAEGGFAEALAAECARRAMEMFSPSLIVCAGFSAGARAGLPTGSIVVCDKLLAVEGPVYSWGNSAHRTIETDSRALESLRVAMRPSGVEYTIGACLTSPTFVSSAAMKSWIGATFDAATIDMESYWVAREAARCGVPCLPARALLDTVEQDVSPFVGETLSDSSFRRVFRAIGRIATHPADLAGLLRLERQTRAASKALAVFLMRLSNSSLAAT